MVSAKLRELSSWPKIPAPGKVLVPDGKFGLKDTLFQTPRSDIYPTSEINAEKTSKVPGLEWKAENRKGHVPSTRFFSTKRAGQSSVSPGE